MNTLENDIQQAKNDFENNLEARSAKIMNKVYNKLLREFVKYPDCLSEPVSIYYEKLDDVNPDFMIEFFKNKSEKMDFDYYEGELSVIREPKIEVPKIHEVPKVAKSEPNIFEQLNNMNPRLTELVLHVVTILFILIGITVFVTVAYYREVQENKDLRKTDVLMTNTELKPLVNMVTKLDNKNIDSIQTQYFAPDTYIYTIKTRN